MPHAVPLIAPTLLRWTWQVAGVHWPLSPWTALGAAGAVTALLGAGRRLVIRRRPAMLEQVRRSKPWDLPPHATLSPSDERAIRACIRLLSAPELLALSGRFRTGRLGRVIRREIERWIYCDRD